MNKKAAVIGDILTYNLSISNGETAAIEDITFTDNLPPGFKYVSGSFLVDRSHPDEPTIGSKTLTYNLGSLNANKTKTLSYQLIVGAGVTPGEYINRATASGTLLGATYSFLEAKATVIITLDPLFDEGTILGKVFHDKNANGLQDKDEEGLSEVRLVMEDGTVVKTDKDGKYHIPAIYPETHLLKVDPNSLPKGAKLTTESPLTLRMTNGLLAKASFGVKLPAKSSDREVIITDTLEKLKKNPLPSLFEEFFLVFLGEQEITKLKADGAIEQLKPQDKYQGKYYFDSRVAYYLKAKVKGSYLLTSSLDTDRQKKYLFRNLDPDKYYPIYGDDSTRDYSAVNTLGRFYIRIEKDRSYATWGNFFTDINAPELAKHNKAFYGGKVYIQSLKQTKFGDTVLQASAFKANENYLTSHNRFRATGTSLYYLKHKDLLEGSERVHINIEDKISGLATARIDLSRADYDIDYDQGRIILKKPIQSVGSSSTIVSEAILDGNPIYFEVDYTYKAPSLFDKDNYGGRISRFITDFLRVGATYVKEERENKNYTLTGVDTTLRLNKDTKLTFEAAGSQQEEVPIYYSTNGGLDFARVQSSNKTKGQAYAFNGQTVFLRKLTVESYYKYIQPGFTNSSTISSLGTVKWGASALYKPKQNLNLMLRHDSIRSLAPKSLTQTSTEKGELQNISTAQVSYSPMYRLDLMAEYRLEQVSELTTSFAEKITQSIAAQGVYKLTDNLQLLLKEQQTIQGKTNNQHTVGINYELTDKTTFNISETLGNKGNSTLVGLSHKLSKDNTVYANQSLTSQESRTTLGQNQKLNETTQVRKETSVLQEKGGKQGKTSLVSLDKSLNKNTNLSLTYERSQFSDRGITSNRDAVSSTYQHTLAEKLGLTSKQEYRFDKGTNGREHQWLTYNNLRYQFNPDLSLLLQANFSFSYDSSIDSTLAKFAEFKSGLSFRPINFDRLNLLTQYKQFYDKGPSSQDNSYTDVQASTSHIASIEFSYDLNRYLQLVEKTAFKLKREGISDHGNLRSRTSLWVNRFNLHIDDLWNLGLEYRLLSQHTSKTYKRGFLIEIDRNITKFLQFSLGYNFTNFDDELTHTDEYDYSGWIYKLRAKY